MGRPPGWVKGTDGPGTDASRRAGQVSTNGKSSTRSGYALPLVLRARTQQSRAACRSRLERDGSVRPAGWPRLAWLRHQDDSHVHLKGSPAAGC